MAVGNCEALGHFPEAVSEILLVTEFLAASVERLRSNAEEEIKAQIKKSVKVYNDRRIAEFANRPITDGERRQMSLRFSVAVEKHRARAEARHQKWLLTQGTPTLVLVSDTDAPKGAPQAVDDSTEPELKAVVA